MRLSVLAIAIVAPLVAVLAIASSGSAIASSSPHAPQVQNAGVFVYPHPDAPPKAVTDLAARVAVNAFDLSYDNIPDQLKKIDSDMTKSAQQAFYDALTVSGQIPGIIVSDMTAEATVTGPAVVAEDDSEGVGRGWIAIVPVSVTYSIPRQPPQKAMPFKVELHIINAGTRDKPDYKVSEFIAQAAFIGGIGKGGKVT